MTTKPQTIETHEESLERAAARLVRESDLKLYGKRRQRLEDLIFFALRDRDQRAARIIKEHREMDICRDNCWTTITNQILGRPSGKEGE